MALSVSAHSILTASTATNLAGETLSFNSDLSLKLVRFIQAGSYAHVFEAVREQDSKSSFAVKCIAKKDLSSDSIHKQRFEAETLLKLSTAGIPSIITSFGHCETDEYIFIAMNRYQDDLLDLINDGSICASSPTSFYDWDDAMDMGLIVQDVFMQVCDAVDACHRHGIFHQDIKPENILINTCRNRVQAHLGDFGLATKNPFPDTFGCGSISCTSPESLEGLLHSSNANSYSARAQDQWGLAILLFIMITGYTPWYCAAASSDASFAAYQAWIQSRKLGNANTPSNLKKRFGFTNEVESFFEKCFDAEDEDSRMTVSEMRQWVSKADVVFVEFGSASIVLPVSLALVDVGTPEEVDELIEGRDIPATKERSGKLSRQHSWSSDFSEMDYSAIPVFDESIMESLILDEEIEEKIAATSSPVTESRVIEPSSTQAHANDFEASMNQNVSHQHNPFLQYRAPNLSMNHFKSAASLGPHTDNWRCHRAILSQQQQQFSIENIQIPASLQVNETRKWTSRRVEALRLQQEQKQSRQLFNAKRSNQHSRNKSIVFSKRVTLPHHQQSPAGSPNGYKSSPQKRSHPHPVSTTPHKSSFWKSASLVREEDWVWRRQEPGKMHAQGPVQTAFVL
ncbi:kinase-like domain-containing protein [Chytriomyces cf. hyalinus JEL632]|nr:kinase-like domain-containing protein [Chytriomyces cf. hyalinus JEL632]